MKFYWKVFFQPLSKGSSSYFTIKGNILLIIIHTAPQSHLVLYKGKAEEQKPSPAQGGPAIPDTKELTLHQKLNLAPISWPEELMA